MPENEPRIPGLVSIVTPCLNGAPFLAKTIASVLAQTYPSLEYIVVDGGSSDASLSIAGTFGSRVRTIKLPRSSQAEAGNAGFRASRGEFFTLLGGDDILEPTAIEQLVAALRAAPGTPFAYADARFIGAADENLGSYPTRDFDLAALAQTCFICQPATLIRADALERAGALDERYRAAFDYDLWIRFGRDYPSPTRVRSQVAATRMHHATQTFRTPRQNLREIRGIVRGHFGYVPFSWVHMYAGLAVSKCDTFFNTPQGSPRRTLLTLLVGLADNRRQPLRFLREFTSEVRRLRGEKRAAKIR